MHNKQLKPTRLRGTFFVQTSHKKSTATVVGLAKRYAFKINGVTIK
jgi:hypothetical protein